MEEPAVTTTSNNNPRNHSLSSSVTATATSIKSSAGRNNNSNNYVWIRTDIVEAIWNNHGTLPKGWKPSRRRGRDGQWGWARAYVVQSSTGTTTTSAVSTTDRRFSSTSSSTSSSSSSLLSYRLKAVEGNNTGKYLKNMGVSSYRNSTVLATITIDDDEFAPPHLQGATVSLSYDTTDTETVCIANTWWMQSEATLNDPPPPPPDDLTSLTHLHEPSVVYCLQRRFQQNSIYTYTGKVLLALNPFQLLEGVYGEDVMRRYDSSLSTIMATDDLQSPPPPPHVYAVARDTYRALMDQGDNQTILVSGESGSGKTVTVKIIMGYLANQSRNTTMSPSSQRARSTRNHHYQHHHHLLDDFSWTDGEGIESQILYSNPILESFGNARTVRNDNSSRFGKFLQLRFTPSAGALVSASIETYLLEKVRLVTQAPGERNYHIFYELLAGLSQEERKDLRIDNETAQDFRMTASSGTFLRRDGVDDRETFQSLQIAMETVGVSKIDQRNIFAIVCAMLHMSNVSFQSVEPGADGCQLEYSQSLEDALHLLGVTHQALNDAFCVCAIHARGEVFHKKLTVAQGKKAREAFIKVTYEALFKYIVVLVNKSINAEVVTKIPRENLPRIGVLDIFGFESFEHNSFEQLCINYCNEALQQQFNKFVFKIEQQEYDEEGIDWSFIDFPDNQDVLDLIEKRRDGIFDILDEKCRLASCTDASFVRAIIERCEKHPRFSASQTQMVDQTFTIQHYLGRVTYSGEGFLEKNKDELPKETTELLLSSSEPFLAHLGELLKNEGGKEEVVVSSRESGSTANSKFGRDNGHTVGNNKPLPLGREKMARQGTSSILQKTVASQFSMQLQELRQRIDTTTPHYVRCLKPNEDLLPGRFEANIIADQLRCAGVLEAIRVSRVGFPHRFYHEQFLDRYDMLLNSRLRNKDQGRKACVSLISVLVPQVLALFKEPSGAMSGNDLSPSMVSLGMQVGFSKVFLRSQVFRAIESLRFEKLRKSTVLIQKHVRRFQAQFRFHEICWAAVAIQCCVRKIKVERKARFRKHHSAAARIQSFWRRFLAETELMAAKLIAHFCQAYRRGALARRLVVASKTEKHAIVVQRCWRGSRNRRTYKKTLLSVITTQCFIRRFVARRRLKRLKREARSLEAISEERNRYKEEAARLRNEVEQLRSLKGQETDVSSNEEVDRLRLEVSRLQAILVQRQFNVSDHVSGLQDFENLERVYTNSPQGVYNRSFDPWRRQQLLSDDWNHQNPGGNADSPTPAAVSLSDAASSPNVSLLDTDRDFEFFTGEVVDRVVLLDDGSLMVDKSQMQHHSNMMSHTPTLHERGEETYGHPATHPGSFLHEHEEEKYGHRMDKNPVEDLQYEMTQLHSSIRNDEQDLTVEIINRSLDPLVLINLPSENGRTALHEAAKCGNLKAAEYLIGNGAVTNAQDFMGDTALHLSKGAAMISLLLKTGNANPNIPNADGICALHVQVTRLDVEAVRLLLESGAKVGVADNTNWFTPLHLAVMGTSEVKPRHKATIPQLRTVLVDLLCGNGLEFELNDQDRHGNAPLHYAVQLETPDTVEIVNTLLRNGADPNLSNQRNQQALLLLCHNNGLLELNLLQECMYSLLCHGSDPNHQSSTGCTPLHLSLYHHDIDSAVLLVRHSAELHLLWKKVGNVRRV
jgi:myosin V